MNEPQFSAEYLEMVERLDGGDPPETPAKEPPSSGSERRLVLGSSRPQCMFASLSKTIPQCEKPATRKWGGLWFCDEHGSRNFNSENASVMASADEKTTPKATTL